MIVERTTYTPRPDCFEQVKQTRFAACATRVGMGLPAGRVFAERTENRVHWECSFANAEEHSRDLACRDSSPDFAAVRQRMTELITDFQRSVLEQCFPPQVALRDTDLEGVPLVPQEQTFTSDGRSLTGFLFLPPGEGPFPCMIWNHGSGIHQGTQDLCRPGSAAVLLRWGVAVFMPHRRGYGNSPGMGWKEEVNAEMGTPLYDTRLKCRLAAESDDVLAAHTHVRKLPQIDADHVGVMGSSFGGIMTLVAAARDSRFRCAVEFAGAAMNWEAAPGLREYLLQQAAQLRIPVCFLQTANDYSTRPTHELTMAARSGGNVQVIEKIFPSFGLNHDEGHFLCGQGAEVWKKTVRLFLNRWL